MRRSFALVLLVGFVVSCNKTTDVDVSKDTVVGIGCAGDGDPACGQDGVCVLAFCRVPCSVDDDCPQGALCIGSNPYGCQLTWDAFCNSSQPCNEGLVCGVDHTCRMPCKAGVPCSREDQQCVDGACYNESESILDAGGE